MRDKKINCAGNCAGLHNLAPNKIFPLLLPVKFNRQTSGPPAIAGLINISSATYA